MSGAQFENQLGVWVVEFRRKRHSHLSGLGDQRGAGRARRDASSWNPDKQIR
jgi:hypothetical protein